MVLDEAKDAENNENVLGEIFVKLGEVVRANAEGEQIDSLLTGNMNEDRQHEIMIKAEPVFKAEKTITIKVMWRGINNKKRAASTRAMPGSGFGGLGHTGNAGMLLRNLSLV